MSDATLAVVAVPYVLGGWCWCCERATPHLYVVQCADEGHAVCGGCGARFQWITAHASALAETWDPPDEDDA
jgi:hypothetical protein